MLLADSRQPTTLYHHLFPVIRAKAPLTLWFDQVVIPRLLEKEKTDLFFSPYYKIPFSAKCRKVITIHDLHFLDDPLRQGASRFFPYVRYLKNAVQQADKVITVSNFSRQEVIRRLDADPSKVKVVYNGVGRVFRVLGEEARETINSKYKINFKYILFVGNMLPHKNISGLLKAWASLKDKSEFKLIIVAKKDPHYQGLVKRVKELSLEQEVIFLELLAEEDLALFYNCAEVFVFPSFCEGFGLPPLEAMACGTPVACSNIPALKEVLGESVLYIDPNDPRGMSHSLSGLLRDKPLREAYREKGLNQAKKYDSRVFSFQLQQELRECVSRGK